MKNRRPQLVRECKEHSKHLQRLLQKRKDDYTRSLENGEALVLQTNLAEDKPTFGKFMSNRLEEHRQVRLPHKAAALVVSSSFMHSAYAVV